MSVPGLKPPNNRRVASAGVNKLQLASIAHHAAQLRDVVDAIIAGHAPAITGADGLRAVGFVEAAYIAAERGTSVRLDTRGCPVV